MTRVSGHIRGAQMAATEYAIQGTAYREFLAQFILARRPDGPEALWNAMLDAKAAWALIDREVENFTKPGRDLAAAVQKTEHELRKAQWQHETEARKRLLEQASPLVAKTPRGLMDSAAWTGITVPTVPMVPLKRKT